MIRTHLRHLILVLILLSGKSFSHTLNIDFTSFTLRGSGLLFWNKGLGRLQPPLEISGWDSGSGGNTDPIDLGDGRHGSFEYSTYANFSVNGDISGDIIRLDLSRFANLQVTKFHLLPNWRIIPEGNVPWVIRSQSDILIEGTIECQGANGGNVVTGNLSAIGIGGAGRCGGARGGDGGAVGVSGENGQARTATLDFGKGGTAVTGETGAGGGGGGAYSNDPPGGGSDGSAVGTGGGAGMNDVDDGFTEVEGSAGGGGGAGSDNITGAGASAGAGGGGGGGVVLMYAGRHVRLEQDAFIDVRGGAGGHNDGNGGAGGGGGGGSVLIFAAGDLYIDGSVTATQISAMAAAQATSAGGGAGGEGSQGRTWLTNATNTITGTGTEAPLTNLVSAGFVLSDTGNFVHTSRAMDLLSTLSVWQSFVSSPVSADITLEVGGSDTEDGTYQFEPVVNISSLNKKRFFKFRVTVNSAVAATPVVVNGLTFVYDTPNKEPFNFTSSGCGRVGASGFGMGVGIGGSRGAGGDAGDGNITSAGGRARNGMMFTMVLMIFLFSAPLVLIRSLRTKSLSI